MKPSRLSSRPERLLKALLFVVGAFGVLRAQAPQDLARDPIWRAMLHFAPGAAESSVDTPAFFLSPEGHHDPAAELAATLAHFEDPETVSRFPGRLEWLAARMGRPAPHCEAFEEVWSRLQPRSAVFVFADAYIASPASMFGHTLLVIRGAHGADPLQQAVNYAATTQETNGLRFAYRGIFGKYPGAYSLMPYHQKLEEYTHTEHRDLWEYELNLDAAGLRRLLLHLWEVRGMGAPYYFFSRNCSYEVLHLLQVACPDRDFFRDLPPWVLPLDTLRVVEASGLVRSVHWRPSLANQVRLMADGLDRHSTSRALALGRGASPEGASPQELDLASAWLQAERARLRVDLPTYQRVQMGLLQARARLGAEADPPTPVPPVAPHLAHGSQRLSLAWSRDGGREALELRWRPALHDWMDPQAGFAPGSEVSFGEVGLRLRTGEDRPRLGDVLLLRVRAFRPVDAFFQPPSWTAGLGWREEHLGPTGAPRRVLAGDMAAGATWGGSRISAYLLAGGEGRGVPGASTLAVNGEGGLLMDWRDRLRGRLFLKAGYRFLGPVGTDREAGGEARIQLGHQLRLGLELSRRDTLGFRRTEGGLSCSWYF
nr:DUF4105 domain-containing protein [uncultured Holophaga sp.]